jgi:hypothetical protein
MGLFSKKDEKQAATPKHADIGRNDPCHCGSGKKYKKCHEEADQSAARKVLDENWSKSEALAKEQAEKNAKEAKDAPPVAKHSSNAPTAQSKHQKFIPTQVSTPRKSGGG